jgi:CubicO group peptidase (beta-lactamase class C family)
VVQNAQLPGRILHSILVERHGRLLAERYLTGHDQPINQLYGIGVPFSTDTAFGAETLHDIRSASKSIVSLLVGILLPNLDVSVASYFPEVKLAANDPRRKITIQNLLDMSSGLDWHEDAVPNDETALYWESDFANYVLGKRLVTQPGSVFNYNSGGTALIAEVLVKVGGKPLTELVRDRLFLPLGITNWEWVKDIHGRPLAFTGLRMLPRDLLKIGQLMLNGGKWGEKQIVPESWVEASLKGNIGTGLVIPPGKDGQSSYGDFWWSGMVGKHHWVAAFGNGGQRLVRRHEKLTPGRHEELTPRGETGIGSNKSGRLGAGELPHGPAYRS